MSGARRLTIVGVGRAASACRASRMSLRRCFWGGLAVLCAIIFAVAMSGAGAAAAVSGSKNRSRHAPQDCPYDLVHPHTRVDAGAVPESGKTLCMHRNRLASPKLDIQHQHYRTEHHDTDHGTPSAARAVFLLGRTGKISSILGALVTVLTLCCTFRRV